MKYFLPYVLFNEVVWGLRNFVVVVLHFCFLLLFLRRAKGKNQQKERGYGYLRRGNVSWRRGGVKEGKGPETDLEEQLPHRLKDKEGIVTEWVHTCWTIP